MRSRLAVILILTLSSIAPALADGPQDNVPGAVRRIPKEGIEVDAADRERLESQLAGLDEAIDKLAAKHDARVDDLLPDVRVFAEAVRVALKYREFFAAADVRRGFDLLAEGRRRADQLLDGKAPWAEQTGLVVRGYVSKIDGSVQPYGLVVPETYARTGPPARLDVWFHGRGEALSEVNFLAERLRQPGQFRPAGTIVLHPYGRYCNAFKFAGEVDVLEAIESVRKHYRIDDDRVSVRGFSMGGAACWQFAVHYADHWFAANPGAGFAETRRFLEKFQRETLDPTWYERKLWHLYDCTDVAANLLQCPTVAYSGEIDAQKQAADVMAEALKGEGIELTHIIGPKTPHRYHPDAAREVERRLDSLAARGRDRLPREVRLVTYTLKYNRMSWVTIDALGEHWDRAEVRARVAGASNVEVTAGNVAALTLEFPAGWAPFEPTKAVSVAIDGRTIEGPKPGSDRSWRFSLTRDGSSWKAGMISGDALRKRHDLQGPIDDAFMDSFLFVLPTGKGSRAEVQAWVEAESARAVEHWRRQFRGTPRVKKDTEVNDEDIATSNLVLWGDPGGNALVRRVAPELPIAWDADSIRVGDRHFDARKHVLLMIYPNPLNPRRYVVLNSGFTYRDYDYLNNASQVPKLPDWAVVGLDAAPDARRPGRVVAADFFGESWELRPPREDSK
ncbi:MAG TPA: prolyl oligopeptidase family serine peptidase [Isosphaeraceae bacterium]|jgi:dienelactone hydrolase|nr:prolyl oligopeptidase family serine peptidase [Isosphaeraceae bacterium]